LILVAKKEEGGKKRPFPRSRGDLVVFVLGAGRRFHAEEEKGKGEARPRISTNGGKKDGVMGKKPNF